MMSLDPSTFGSTIVEDKAIGKWFSCDNTYNGGSPIDNEFLVTSQSIIKKECRMNFE